MPPSRVPLEVLSREGGPPERFEVSVQLPGRQLPSQARSPSLALEVRSADGGQILLPPAALPPEDREPLAPDAEGDVSVLYSAFLDPSLPAGPYLVRFGWPPPGEREGEEPELESDWTEFEVLPSWEPDPDDFWPPEPWLRRLFERWPDWPWPKKCHWKFAGAVDACRSQRIEKIALKECAKAAESSDSCAAEAGLYGWHARFHLLIDESSCTAHVGVRIRYDVASDVDQPINEILDNLRKVIRYRWHDRFRLCVDHDCCEKGYPIHLHVKFLPANTSEAWHQHVKIQTSTTHMNGWSYTTDKVEHEFGHMLGAKDEYCTVDGRHYCKPHEGHNIMNTTAKNPIPEHLALVADAASRMTGCCCRIEAKNVPCPKPGYLWA